MSEVVTYKCRDVSFIITPTKVAVKTSLQLFILEPAEPYFDRRLKTVRMLIEIREIDDISKLLGYSQGKLKWVAYKEKWLYDKNIENEREHVTT